MQRRTYGELRVTIRSNSDAVGMAAGDDFAATVASLLGERDEITVLMATGNSQRGFRDALRARGDIEWSRITVLHVDEYLGVSDERPESTAWRMRADLVDRVHPKSFIAMRGDHQPVEEEIARYSALIQQLRPSICVMGVGGNGHLAFNDPPADFDSRELVKIVSLTDSTKRQIVDEGRFSSIDEVPRQALTLTIHALLQPENLFIIVPEARKAAAVKAALEGPVTALCPASILRTRPDARMYLDQESSALLAPLRALPSPGVVTGV